MFPIPTDRLYKFTAIAGLALMLAAGAGLLGQHNETGLQQNEFAGKVLSMGAIYEEFAERTSEQIKRTERLHTVDLPNEELKKLQAEDLAYREFARKSVQEFRAAEAAAKKQQFLVQHHHAIRRLWVAIAALAFALGLAASIWGFRHWLIRSRDES